MLDEVLMWTLNIDLIKKYLAKMYPTNCSFPVDVDRHRVLWSGDHRAIHEHIELSPIVAKCRKSEGEVIKFSEEEDNFIVGDRCTEGIISSPTGLLGVVDHIGECFSLACWAGGNVNQIAKGEVDRDIIEGVHVMREIIIDCHICHIQKVYVSNSMDLHLHRKRWSS